MQKTLKISVSVVRLEKLVQSLCPEDRVANTTMTPPSAPLKSMLAYFIYPYSLFVYVSVHPCIHLLALLLLEAFSENCGCPFLLCPMNVPVVTLDYQDQIPEWCEGLRHSLAESCFSNYCVYRRSRDKVLWDQERIARTVGGALLIGP